MSSIAFFDVDETLIRPKSMFALLEFYLLANRVDGAAVYRARWAEICGMSQSGAPRSEINRHFYRLWAGEPHASVIRAGRDWVAGAVARGSFFIEPAVRALDEHRATGSHIVLVSGSFPAAVEPIAERLGVERILCTRPEVKDGIMTGAIEFPMIGANKARAAKDVMNGSPSHLKTASPTEIISPTSTFWLVGNPRIVAHDPDLIAVATARNWRVLQ
ncbi:MAG: HAD-IB family hydrolase [Rhodoblastus sp.]|nr:MAG: HAD-IB family hydrolase [Rhodoblastus sp.]